MPERQRDEVLIQLATRIPKRLHVAIKLHCVETETRLADFISAAIRERLRRNGRARD